MMKYCIGWMGVAMSRLRSSLRSVIPSYSIEDLDLVELPNLYVSLYTYIYIYMNKSICTQKTETLVFFKVPIIEFAVFNCQMTSFVKQQYCVSTYLIHRSNLWFCWEAELPPNPIRLVVDRLSRLKECRLGG